MKRRLSIVLVVAMIQLVCVSTTFATPIHDVVRVGNTAEVKRLLDLNPANANAEDILKRTPLHYAAAWGRTAIAQALIASGANLEALTDRFDALTPLLSAAYYGRTEIVQALLAAGANANAVDKSGRTPLKLAQENRHATTAAALQPQAIAKTHTQTANAHITAGNHRLAARSYTWAAQALPETEEARLSYTKAAESFTLAGNHGAAAESFVLAGNHSAAAQSYISAQDFASASQSYHALFNSYAARVDLPPADRTAAIDEAEAQAIVALETAADAVDGELEAADIRHDEVAVTALRAQAFQIQDAIGQVGAHAAASRVAIE